MMGVWLRRLTRLLFGLVLYSLGSYMGIQANVGLGAWEAFGVGVSSIVPLTYGEVTILTGVVILVLDVILGEKIGLGTILNTLLIGKIIDLFAAVELLPRLQNFWLGVGMMLLGQVVICLGVYFYVGAGMGAGPRDSLMVAVGKRLPRLPIGVVRGCTEGAALLLGWLLGAKVGVGTLIAVFGISLIMQGTFRVLRFNVKAVQHETIAQTLRTWPGRRSRVSQGEL